MLGSTRGRRSGLAHTHTGAFLQKDARITLTSRLRLVSQLGETSSPPAFSIFLDCQIVFWDFDPLIEIKAFIRAHVQ
jgi:hypothetical protein